MASKKRVMPKWTKAPESLVTFFNDTVSGIPGAEIRKMFGYPVAFYAGQMFCGLFQNSMMMRLSEQERGSFITKYESRLFEPIPGRPMREYVLIPESLIKAPKELKSWILKSCEFAARLPPKVSGKPKTKKAANK